MVDNILNEPTINNKESLINDIFNEQSTKVNNNLEEPTINNNILNDNNEKTTLEESKINNIF